MLLNGSHNVHAKTLNKNYFGLEGVAFCTGSINSSNHPKFIKSSF